MERKPARLLRAANIVEKRRWFSQRLNPSSRFRVSSLGEAGGLERVGVSIAWLPPGKESFAFHAHRYEEEGCTFSKAAASRSWATRKR